MRNAWYTAEQQSRQAEQHARQLQWQLQMMEKTIEGLQDAAAQGARSYQILQEVLVEKAELRHKLAELHARMTPQPPSHRALLLRELSNVAPQAQEPCPEPTPQPAQAAPSQTAQPQRWRLSIKVRAISLADQQAHGSRYPPVTLRLAVRPAKRERGPAEQPLLLSPKPLGPMSFSEAACSQPALSQLLRPAMPTQQGGVAPQPMHQSIVQMLHVGGVRLGYVPVHRSAVQQPRRADAACDRPRSSRGHPFVINGFRQSEREFECATPVASEADPNEVLVCETPPCRQTTIHCVAAPSSSSNVMHVSETSDTD